MTDHSRSRGLVLGLLMSLLAAFPAQAASTDLGGATQHVESLGRSVLASLQAPKLSQADREAALSVVLQEGVAVDLIGRFVLGRYWRSATPAERTNYQSLFRDFMVKSYAGYLNGLAGSSFEIVQAVPVGEQDVLVNTRIDTLKGNEFQAGWRVRRIDGSYKIIDVVVEGVSLAATQRQDFSSVVGRQGVAGLLDILRTRTATATASR